MHEHRDIKVVYFIAGCAQSIESRWITLFLVCAVLLASIVFFKNVFVCCSKSRSLQSSLDSWFLSVCCRVKCFAIYWNVVLCELIPTQVGPNVRLTNPTWAKILSWSRWVSGSFPVVVKVIGWSTCSPRSLPCSMMVYRGLGSNRIPLLTQ